MGRVLGAAFGVALVAALAGCTPEPAATSESETVTRTTPTPTGAVTFTSVVDGDTIETSDGTVRIIGIDAPESGACGHLEASALVSSLLTAGDPVDLGFPDGQNDTDQYERLLRYVDTAAGVDVGLSLIQAGLAVARYDSTDGYPAHPPESAYRAAQTATLGANGTVVTVDCKAAADTAEQERIAAEQRAAEDVAAPVVDEWWRQYGSCSQLKKNTNGHPVGPFNVNNPDEAALYDWFQFGTGHSGDGDGDGLACE